MSPSHPFVDAQHAAAESAARAHPAPERCDCPGHDVFVALAAVAAAYAHETLAPGATCQTCGYREPMSEASPAPGQMAAWAAAEVDAAEGAVVSWGEALGVDEGPAFYIRPWDPA